MYGKSCVSAVHGAKLMKYFKDVESLSDLKEQYRKLAVANHPDKGGETTIMQEINSEYDVLFPIWKNLVNDTTDETAQSTRRQFYTQYGWEGSNYNINLRMTDITKIIREYVKEKYPTYKFSVRTRDVYSLDIALMEAPQEVFIPENLSEYEKKDYDKENLKIQLNPYYIEKDDRITELCRQIMEDVKKFAQTYNFNDSDSMIDYFHTNFYLHLNIGSYDKPFKIVERTARVKHQQSTQQKHPGSINSKINTATKPTDLNLEIVDYSERAIVVYGDTFPIKEQLKQLGGKYNRNLKGGAGWIFSKSKKEEIEKLISE